MADNYEKDITESKIDIGILKQQVNTLTELCNKIDNVIEKLIEQHDRHIAKVYTDMEERRKESQSNIDEVHLRIDTVLDKLQASEMRLLDEIKSLRKDMLEHNQKERDVLDKILAWKWMLAGGIIVVSWIISHGTEIIARVLLTK